MRHVPFAGIVGTLLVLAACAPRTINGGEFVDAGALADGGVALRGPCGPPITAIRTLISPDAFGSEVAPDRSAIAVNKRGSDGIYHLYLMDLDGGNLRPLGSSNASMPQKNAGSPVYHPSGKYIAFAAEKATHDGASSAAVPGWGGYSDLWLTTADGSQVWQLTNTPNDADHGTIIPVFSARGDMLEWTERTAAANVFNTRQVSGYWVLKVADFVDDASGPHLENVRQFSPGGDAFNESGGFTPDGSGLLLTSDFATNNFWTNQIFRMDLASSATTQLTQDGYNEHPRYTPDGRIIWMGPGQNSSSEWWVMDADGSNKTQLSSFSVAGHVESAGQAVYPGPVPAENWSADGSSFIADVETNLVTTTYDVVEVQLTCP
jgi:Tol biopolymer transport system component